jgi:drug/metabolite transporter (DMT)-like permease
MLNLPGWDTTDAVIGSVFLGKPANLWQLVGILIVVGVILINLFGSAHG